MDASDELLIVVPARGGSKRLPRKNLRPLLGRNLLERTADVLAEARIGGTCLLSTDDDEIAAMGTSLGWSVPFRRPPHLATDDAATESVVLHALDWFRADRGRDPPFVMVLQVTSPFRGGACLAMGLAALCARPDADAVVAMGRLHRMPRQLYRRGGDGFVVPLSNEAAPRPILTPNGALYVVRASVLRETGSLLPPRTLALVMDPVAGIDIDDVDDWRLAEAVGTMGLVGRALE